MPARPKTSEAEIIAATRNLLEQRGSEGFTMGDIAAAVGVRAPSLYVRFRDRSALLSAVQIGLWRELEQALRRASRSPDPLRTLTAQARAYRGFARAHPRGYALMFDPGAERTEEGQAARAAAAAPALPAFAALVGEREALSAARVLTPFLHGFVSMELAGAFRLGPGIDEAFERGVAIILAGLQGSGKRAARQVRRRHSRS
jgi:AcrR family transcriptional regulator